MVPKTRDPAALIADTFTVIQKASRMVWPSLRRKSLKTGRLRLERDVELTDGGGRLRGDLGQVPGQGLPPAAVADHGPQGVVNGGDALGIALLEPDSVDLVAEERADDLELAFVLRLGREAGQDRVVGRDGYLSLLEKGLAVGRQRRHEIDLRGTELVRDVPGDVDIEPRILAGRRLPESAASLRDARSPPMQEWCSPYGEKVEKS